MSSKSKIPYPDAFFSNDCSKCLGNTRVLDAASTMVGKYPL